MARMKREENERLVENLLNDAKAGQQEQQSITLEKVVSKYSTCMCCGVGNEEQDLKMLNIGTTFQTTSVKLCSSCRYKLHYVLIDGDA